MFIQFTMIGLEGEQRAAVARVSNIEYIYQVDPKGEPHVSAEKFSRDYVGANAKIELKCGCLYALESVSELMRRIDQATGTATQA